ncbi:MAG: bacillithiol biosynthesis cysteine-adding enzyme BshC [Rhodothermales bacterium]|nr:bacillithiol biosynthesis cysteine-adding enzyme BshC [Rhodothermales bacterium]MBO6779077.1 bacillithiol biosynthesis cysteine-adding enzyme BshC [Rhodothermales bacterium]
MEADCSVASDIQRVPYGEIAGFSDLFVDYTASREEAVRFYGGGFDRETLLARARETAAAPHADREALVQILRDQHRLWGDDPSALANIEKLADPEAAAIVTGQQVGLFGGPAYSVLKAMTSVLLARELEAASGRPFVPVFWLGSEDHDFEEMATAHVPGGSFTYPKPPVDNTGPVGALTFGPEINELVDALEAALPGTDFRGQVMGAVRNCYREGETFRDGFARLMRMLLPGTGLVIFAQDDPRVKRLATPLWRKEIRDSAGSDAALRSATEHIAREYHAQVHIRPSNLFMIHEGQRLPLDVDDGRFHLRGTDQSWSASDLEALLDAEPERFSPNVVTRPLTQDWLFPTAAYVGGPGETAYFGQYRGVYAWADLVMPVIFPRVSLTFIEPGIRRSLDKLGEPPARFSKDADKLFAEIARERLEVDVEGTFGRTIGEVNKLIGPLAPVATAVDPSLKKSVDATRAAMQKELIRLKERVLKADRRNHDQLRAQVEKVADGLFPMGKPQERVLSPLYFTTKYGMDFYVCLMDRLDTDTRSHLLVDL